MAYPVQYGQNKAQIHKITLDSKQIDTLVVIW